MSVLRERSLAYLGKVGHFSQPVLAKSGTFAKTGSGTQQNVAKKRREEQERRRPHPDRNICRAFERPKLLQELRTGLSWQLNRHEVGHHHLIPWSYSKTQTDETKVSEWHVAF
jgi:hypothetical protein